MPSSTEAGDSIAAYMRDFPAGAGAQLCPASGALPEDAVALQAWYQPATAGGKVVLNPTAAILRESALDPVTRRIRPAEVTTYVATLLNEFDGAAITGGGGAGSTAGSSAAVSPVEQRMARDRMLAASLRAEYCFYEARYQVALRLFLEKATSRTANAADVKAMLEVTKALNLRLNALLEVANMLAMQRVQRINTFTADVNSANAQIRARREQMDRLGSHLAVLQRNDAALVTQRELVRYTEEKNRYAANQVTVFVALNALALAALVYAYHRGT